MKNLLHLFLLSLTLALLTTCRDTDCQEPQEPCPCTGQACVDSIKSYYFFQPGSYWIYEEVNSGALDTVVVYYASDESGAPDQNFRMEVSSSVVEEFATGLFAQYNYYYQLRPSRESFCFTRTHCRCLRLERVKGRPTDYVATGTFSLEPFIVDDYVYTEGGGALRNKDSYQGYVQNGISYSTVRHVGIDVVNTEFDQPCEFYIAKNVGIIRKDRLESGESWRLIEYNAIQ